MMRALNYYIPALGKNTTSFLGLDLISLTTVAVFKLWVRFSISRFQNTQNKNITNYECRNQ